jgi:hypothetical protein
LARAIGARGQNARLASQLTRWKLDIHSEGEERKRTSLSEEELNLKYLEDFLIQVVPDSELHRRNFFQSRFDTVEKIALADVIQLEPLLEGSGVDAASFIDQAKYYVEALANFRQTEFGENYHQENEGDSQASEDSGEESSESESSNPA